VGSPRVGVGFRRRSAHTLSVRDFSPSGLASDPGTHRRGSRAAPGRAEVLDVQAIAQARPRRRRMACPARRSSSGPHHHLDSGRHAREPRPQRQHHLGADMNANHRGRHPPDRRRSPALAAGGDRPARPASRRAHSDQPKWSPRLRTIGHDSERRGRSGGRRRLHHRPLRPARERVRGTLKRHEGTFRTRRRGSLSNDPHKTAAACTRRTW